MTRFHDGIVRRILRSNKIEQKIDQILLISEISSNNNLRVIVSRGAFHDSFFMKKVNTF